MFYRDLNKNQNQAHYNKPPKIVDLTYYLPRFGFKHKNIMMRLTELQNRRKEDAEIDPIEYQSFSTIDISSITNIVQHQQSNLI